MENNKTQAEVYREERKERLAKAAAKQAKKSPKISKTKRIVGKVIAIVLAVVIGLGAIGGILNFFGVPQKVLKVSIGDSDYSFSVAEYNYYLYSVWYNYQNTALQYDSSYGEGMGASLLGYDYTKSPTEQEYTDDMSAMTGVTLKDIGNPEDATWADAFSYAAISQILQVKFGAAKAEEAGIVLTAEQESDINSTIDTIRERAKKNDYSLDRWFHTQMGKGLSEKVLRQIETDIALSTSYYEKLQKDTLNAVTDEQINAEYKKNTDLYNVIDARIYTLSVDGKEIPDDATADEKAKIEAENKKAAKAAADKFVASVKDEESFIKTAQAAIINADNKSTIKAEESTLAEKVNYANLESVSEELAKWAYDDARKVGDKSAFDNGDGTYTIIYLTKLPHKDTSVSSNDVRHILVAFDEKTDDSGKAVALTDAEKTKYKAEANEILEEYLKNPTVEKFVELTKKHTDDVDTEGNPNNDGLYENVANDGQYVEAFTNWAVDKNRKPGDTGIVETEYGYHIMYYVEANEDAWYATVKNAIFTEKLAEKTDDVMHGYMETVNLDNVVLKWANNSQAKFINKIVVQNY